MELVLSRQTCSCVWHCQWCEPPRGSCFTTCKSKGFISLLACLLDGQLNGELLKNKKKGRQLNSSLNIWKNLNIWELSEVRAENCPSWILCWATGESSPSEFFLEVVDWSSNRTTQWKVGLVSLLSQVGKHWCGFCTALTCFGSLFILWDSPAYEGLGLQKEKQ